MAAAAIRDAAGGADTEGGAREGKREVPGRGPERPPGPPPRSRRRRPLLLPPRPRSAPRRRPRPRAEPAPPSCVPLVSVSASASPPRPPPFPPPRARAPAAANHRLAPNLPSKLAAQSPPPLPPPPPILPRAPFPVLSDDWVASRLQSQLGRPLDSCFLIGCDAEAPFDKDHPLPPPPLRTCAVGALRRT